MNVNPPHLFVYGTLKPSADHALGLELQNHAVHVASGSIQARLYVVTETDAHGTNTYPGAVPSANPADRVFGEVYKITNPDRLFPIFDEYEACTPNWPEPYEFLRRNISVSTPNGPTIWAQCYLYAWDTSQAEFLPNGQFDRSAPSTR